MTLWLWHQEASVYLECTMKIHLSDIFYLFDESPPSVFPLYFRYIYFSLSILLSQNWWQDQFQYVLFPLLAIYLLYIISYLFWISSSNFAYIATAKSRASAENIGIKLSALPTSWPLFTAVLLRLLLGFIKTTDHQPTDSPTFNLPTYIKTEDQILNMFCTLQFLKMLTLIYFHYYWI